MNVEAWDAAGALPMATLPDKLSAAHVPDDKRAQWHDVSARQVVHRNNMVAAFQPDAFQTVSHSFSENASPPSGGDPPNDFVIPNGELPDGDPRGIDGWADVDSVANFDAGPPPSTAGAPHLPSTSRLHTPRVIVDYRRPSHVELVRRIDGLEAKLNQIPLMMGHNGLPSAIDEQQRQIAVLVAGILHETEKLKRQDPQPIAVSEEAKTAATKLEAYKIALIAVASSIGGGMTSAIGSKLVDYCEKHLPEAIAQLQEVIAQLWVWIEAIEQFAKAAGQ